MYTAVHVYEIGPLNLSSFGKLQTFARQDYAYIICDMHKNNIRIRSHLVVDKYGKEH